MNLLMDITSHRRHRSVLCFNLHLSSGRPNFVLNISSVFEVVKGDGNLTLEGGG